MLIVVLLIVLTFGAVIGRSVLKASSEPAIAAIVWPAYAVAVVLSLFFSTYHQVDTGHVGVVYQFGQIVGETGDGPQFITPWRSLREVNVQLQKVHFIGQASHNDDETIEEKESWGAIGAASAETQNVWFDVTVNWQLDRGTVRGLYADVGPYFFTKLIPSRVNQFFKAEVVKYPAIEVTQKRELIRSDVTRALDDELKQYGISIISIQIDNISYNQAFEEAIEQKQVATQQALRAQEQVAQKEAEARQVEATARGAALANVAAAEGDAKAILARASAQAEANTKLSNSLTPLLLQSQAIAKTEGIKYAIVPAGGNVFLTPESLLGVAAGTTKP